MEDKNSENDINPFTEVTATSSSASQGELTIATIRGFDSNGRALLDFQGLPDAIHGALSTITLHPSHVGRQAAIMFLNNDQNQPVVIGLIKSHLDDLLEAMETVEVEPAEQLADTPQNVLVDGKKVSIEGTDEIVLKCGESSITLTKSGKVIIRGKYLLNRSSGVNRILGGSVQVN